MKQLIFTLLVLLVSNFMVVAQTGNGKPFPYTSKEVWKYPSLDFTSGEGELLIRETYDSGILQEEVYLTLGFKNQYSYDSLGRVNKNITINEYDTIETKYLYNKDMLLEEISISDSEETLNRITYSYNKDKELESEIIYEIEQLSEKKYYFYHQQGKIDSIAYNSPDGELLYYDKHLYNEGDSLTMILRKTPGNDTLWHDSRVYAYQGPVITDETYDGEGNILTKKLIIHNPEGNISRVKLVDINDQLLEDSFYLDHDNLVNYTIYFKEYGEMDYVFKYSYK